MEPLGGYFRTYSLGFENFEALRRITGKAAKKMNKDYFNLNRYVFADEQGDFHAVISLGDNFEPSRTTARKPVQTGTQEAPVQDTQAYYNVTLKVPLSMQLLDGERKLIREVDFSGFKAGLAFEFGPFGTDTELAAKWRSEGERAVNVVNARKRRDNNLGSKPTKFVDVFQLRKPEIRRLKIVSGGFSERPKAYLVSRDTVFMPFNFLQVKKGKAMPKIGVQSDDAYGKYSPLQMRAMFDGEHFYEAIAAPRPGNNAVHWMVVKLEANLSNGAIKLGNVVRGGEEPQPDEYIIYGAKIRRPANLSGPDFTENFNAGVFNFFGMEYPNVAAKAKAKKYTANIDGYKQLIADLIAAGK